jgi:hypothetical protein
VELGCSKRTEKHLGATFERVNFRDAYLVSKHEGTIIQNLTGVNRAAAFKVVVEDRSGSNIARERNRKFAYTQSLENGSGERMSAHRRGSQRPL